MRFAYSYLLWLLLVVPPALAIFFWWAWRKRQWLMTQFIQARLLPALTIGLSPRRQKIGSGKLGGRQGPRAGAGSQRTKSQAAASL